MKTKQPQCIFQQAVRKLMWNDISIHHSQEDLLSNRAYTECQQMQTLGIITDAQNTATMNPVRTRAITLQANCVQSASHFLPS